MSEGGVETWEEALALLSRPRHIDREKGVAKLKEWLDDIASRNTCSEDSLHARVCSMLEGEQWEGLVGALLAAKLLVPCMERPAFRAKVLAFCNANLEHKEVRVRSCVADALRVLAEKDGVAVYLDMKDRIFTSVEVNFVRALPEAPQAYDELEDTAHPIGLPRCASPLPDDESSLGRKHTNLMHDTEGWKSLETTFKALQRLMEGTGSAFFPHVTQELLNVIFRSVEHTNRFVRETGYFVIGTLCEICDTNALDGIAEQVATKLRGGLGDNWSMVRYAASVATRKFIAQAEPFKTRVLPLLVPAMCLNRHYVAEGVRLFSIETWKRAMGDTGRQAVAENMASVASYYVAQSKAENHAVREAACHCIAELAQKIAREAVAAHVPELLQALVDCFKDMSWPVRDAACIALGNFVTVFSDESRGMMDELYQLWFAHLSDNIASVREDSAMALGKVMRAYKEEARTRIIPALRDLLPRAKDQPSDSKKYSDLENVTTFGVAMKKLRDNDPELHTGQTAYSCGSLTERARGALPQGVPPREAQPVPVPEEGGVPGTSVGMLRRGGGCMDHGFHREQEPWEATDGAVYLLREVSALEPKICGEFLPILAEMANLRQFAHFHSLLETIWKVVPTIAKNMKRTGLFHQHLEKFVPPLFEALDCGNQLAMSAAGEAIGALRTLFKTDFLEILTPRMRKAMDESPFVEKIQPGVRGGFGGRGPIGDPTTSAPWRT